MNKLGTILLKMKHLKKKEEEEKIKSLTYIFPQTSDF